MNIPRVTHHTQIIKELFGNHKNYLYLCIIKLNKMKIKQIFDEIAAEPGTNAKMDILKKYKDNELLRRVLYLANSKRVKYYIKRIPSYEYFGVNYSLEQALGIILAISNRDVKRTRW